MIFDLPNSNSSNAEIETFEAEYIAPLKPEWCGVTYLPRSADYFPLVEKIALHSDDIVLDVGGACSYFAVFIAPQVRKVYLVDSLAGFACAKPWLASMETLDAGVDITQANGADLPFPDAMFDIVFTFSALEHFENDDDIKCIREVYRVLKPGGLFAGSVDYNAITERPQGDDSVCKTYTLRSFFERIVLPADFWPVGDVKLVKIPDVVSYTASQISFILSKGKPPGRILDIGGTGDR